MQHPKIEVTKEDLRKIIYFILMKFKVDPLHRQGTSSKRDLIGGYIERWFNKIAETVTFNKLLKDKAYKVVPDYFLYANDSDKNAPDILGIQSSDKLVPFVKYNNGTWKTIDGMPRIEVKVVRKDQSLVSVREPQMIDDYYAFIESDLEEDYLSTIFEKEVFSTKYFVELVMNSEFIESDINNQIIPPVEIKQNNRVGTIRLIGIYTKDEIKNNSMLCKSGVSPYYFYNACNKSSRTKKKSSKKLVLDEKGLFIYKYDRKHICLPIKIDNPNNSKLTILKKNKSSVYINSTDNISICGIELAKGDIVVEFKKFDRNSKWDENILLKTTLEKTGIDSTEELIAVFDRILA